MLFGRMLPLCARCSGIYLGIMLTLTALLLAGRQRYARFPNRRIMLILGLFVTLMAIDGFNSLAHDFGWGELYQPHNTLRLLTGFWYWHRRCHHHLGDLCPNRLARL